MEQTGRCSGYVALACFSMVLKMLNAGAGVEVIVS
jgi:hypothetical protein